jgi:hypothetical protein
MLQFVNPMWKASERRKFERTEKIGRRLGDRNSLLEIGRMNLAINGRPEWQPQTIERPAKCPGPFSSTALAKLYQLVSPTAVM